MARKKHLAVVIMAAGKGTRMKNPDRAKVLFELNGKPMIHYVVDLAYEINAQRVIVIVGFQRETVTEYIRRSHPDVETVAQAVQKGTGHAVLQTEKKLENFSGDILVLSGDVPLLRRSTIEELISHHRSTDAVATILTAELDNPAGYGRVVRNSDGSVQRIVEHRDADPAERAIREINSGIYLFDRKKLFDGLNHINPHNVQNEYYLTDVFEYFWKHDWVVSALKAPHHDEIRGVNTIEQLEEALEVVTRKAKQ